MESESSGEPELRVPESKALAQILTGQIIRQLTLNCSLVYNPKFGKI